VASSVRRRALVALVVGLAAFATAALEQRAQGIARDEVVYMEAGSRYAAF
jgi:hypothetical protein